MHAEHIRITFRGSLEHLKKFLCGTPCLPPTASFDYKVGLAQPKDCKMHLELTVNTTQKINVAVTKPGDSAPVWFIENGDSTILVAPDGLSADLVSSDFPGETTFSVTGTREGQPINDSVTLIVVEAPPGQDFGLVAGVPVPKNSAAFAKKV